MSGLTSTRRAIALLGALLPLGFVAYVLNLHDMIDFLRGYAPLRYLAYLLLALGLSAIAALVADFALGSRAPRSGRAVHALAWISATVSILITVAFAAYIFVPKYTGGGNIPPRLVLAQAPARPTTPSADTSVTAVSGLAVSFYTTKPTRNTLEWGLVAPQDVSDWPAMEATASVRETTPKNRHWFDLGDLRPGCLYIYSVNGARPVKFFTPSLPRVRFAAAGDAHVGSETADTTATRKMLAAISRPNSGYDAMFLLGDTAQLGFHNGDWVDVGWTFVPWMFAPQDRAIPTALVPGNHDTLLGGIELYKLYETAPPASHAPANASPLWQRIDLGDVHFLLLDIEWDLQTYTPEQKAWLERQLASIPKDEWKIVMCHTFFYASGATENGWPYYDNKPVIDEISPLLEKSGVQLVMSGHQHDMELLRKNGVTYVVAGTFGGKPDVALDYTSPASVWLRQGVLGFVDVAIDGPVATVTFRDKDSKALYTTVVRR